jgi:hypothetical protein
MTNNKLTDEQEEFWLAPDRLQDIAEGAPLVEGEAAGMAQMLLAAQAHIRRQEQIMLNQDESLAIRRAELQEYRKAATAPIAWVDDAGAELLVLGYPAEVAAKKDENFDQPLCALPSQPLQRTQSN